MCIRDRWQRQWDSDTTGRHLHSIEPSVSNKTKLNFSSRSLEVMAHRLRLGRCLLKNYIHEMNKQTAADCNHCGLPETVTHFLVECTQNGLTKIKKSCENHKVNFDIPSILRSAAVLTDIRRVVNRRL